MAAKNVLAGFARLLKENWQTDVQLKAMDSDPGAAISVHKILLAASSKVFKKMFDEDECKASSGEEIITFSEMKHEELQALVHFFYIPYSSKFIRGHKKHVRSLYLAADKYEIPYLRKICRDELVSSLNLANVFEVLELAQIPFDKDLNDAVFNYITENIKTIADSVELKEFADSNPNLTVEMMLEQDERKASSGEVSRNMFGRSLYLAADTYEIPDLRDLCRKDLMSSLNLTNALDVLELAQIPFDYKEYK